MGAHTAPRPCTVGRVAGRTALTAATALALTGGTASVAFAGAASDDATTSRDEGWDHDEYKDGFRDGYRLGYHDGQDEDDDEDDDDRDGWKHDDGKWDDDEKKDHKKKDREKRGGGQFGARYEDSTHKGDDNYTFINTVNKGLLAGIL